MHYVFVLKDTEISARNWNNLLWAGDKSCGLVHARGVVISLSALSSLFSDVKTIQRLFFNLCDLLFKHELRTHYAGYRKINLDDMGSALEELAV